jgi:putative Ca2+/H+ antiporter (TMEM165/GDT1 family)
MRIDILLIAFGILFLGELGDKTQLIVFNLTLTFKKSHGIGIGATLGFGAIVTLGVFFGYVITNFIPLELITIISAIVFIIIGLLEARNLKSLYYEMKNRESNLQINKNKKDQETGESFIDRFKNNSYLAGFFAIFIMELGDKTQILTITLASIYLFPIEVWLGSFLALSALAWIGVFFGALIAKYVPKFYIKVISVVIFILVGIITLISVF